MEQDHPLQGIRVLELGSRTITPYIGKLFTDAGADVLKVESPEGDPFRTWSASHATIPDGEDSAWWRFLNAGKRIATIDLETPQGHEAFLELVDETDLVLDDHKPEDTEPVSYTHLRAHET